MSLGIRNIGPKSEQWLLDVGITSLRDLRRAGAVETFHAIRAARGSVSLNLLYALEAGVRGIDWRDLSPRERAELRRLAQAV